MSPPLDVIAAVVIGGASLLGGEGTVMGTIVGALIVLGIIGAALMAATGSNQRSWMAG